MTQVAEEVMPRPRTNIAAKNISTIMYGRPLTNLRVINHTAMRRERPVSLRTWLTSMHAIRNANIQSPKELLMAFVADIAPEMATMLTTSMLVQPVSTVIQR